MKNKLSVAVIGCEHCHIEGNTRLLEASELADVTTVWAESGNDARRVAAALGAEAVSDWRDCPPVDLVVVNSDTRSHRMIAADLGGKTSAFYFDKPLGLSSADAVKVREELEAHANGKALVKRSAVGYFLRLNPLVEKMKTAIADPDSGAICGASFTFGHSGHLEGWLDGWPVFDDVHRMGYSVFGDLAANIIDTCQYALGPVEPMSASLAKDLRRGGDVGGVAIAELEGGAPVQFFASSKMRGSRFQCRVNLENVAFWLERDRFGTYDESGEPVPLAAGRTSAASDGVDALLVELAGQTPAPLARVTESIEVNTILDGFYAMAGE